MSPVNHETKSVFVTIVICFIVITIISFLVYNHGRDSGRVMSDQAYKKTMDSLQKKNDSLSEIVSLKVSQNDSIRYSIDTLSRRYALIKGILLTQNAQYNQVLKKLNDFKNIDTYGSDSLRAYYRDNFDTTKTPLQ